MKILAAICVVASSIAPMKLNAELVDFLTINNWVGTGPNEAALVVDFSSIGGSSLYWGFRWSGTATGEDMARAIAGFSIDTSSGTQSQTGADLDLALKITSFSFGSFIPGWGYDLDDDGWGGITDNSSSTGATALDHGDVYRESDDFATAFAFWNYFVSDANETWTASGVGISDRVLVDGAVDGFSFTDSEAEPAMASISRFAAVPEPSIITMLAGAGLLLFRRHRRSIPTA